MLWHTLGSAVFVFLLHGYAHCQRPSYCAGLNGRCSYLQNDTTCEQQGLALTSFYRDTNGTGWNHSNNWTKTNVCSIPMDGISNAAPSFCCWYGVTCCGDDRAGDLTESDSEFSACQSCLVTNLTLRLNLLTGSLPEYFFANVSTIRVLDLQSNNMTGSIPANISSANDLKVLNLGYNNFSSTIPNSLASLTNLQQLDIARNILTGSVPAGLCGSRDVPSNLADMYLHNNNLSGPLDLSSCVKLIAVDMQYNSITGSVPIPFDGYNLLHILRMKSNAVSGSLSADTMWRFRHVTNFDLRNNQLTGTIPDTIDELWYLYRLDLSDNSVTGQIPKRLFLLGNLDSIDLSNNSLTGTIPSTIGAALSLTDLVLTTNYLTGTIPESMSVLSQLTKVDFRNNNLSCCYVPGVGYNDSAPYLPSFLTFANYSEPPITAQGTLQGNSTGEGSNMLCLVVVPVNSTTQNGIAEWWWLDPSYYQFQNCSCLQGYDEKWMNVSGNNVLFCEKSSSIWNEMPWLIAIIASCCWLFVMLLLYALCYRRGSKPMIWQTVINVKKRVKGHPTQGEVTVVYTDVEGYEGLMKKHPILMTKALTIHSNIIRNAKWASFGYTVEQEEDICSLVFYEAMDAAQFCLQVQQALMRAEWPEGLADDVASELVPKKSKGTFSIAGAVREAGHWLNSTVTGTVESVTMGFRPKVPSVSQGGATAVTSSAHGEPSSPVNSLPGPEDRKFSIFNLPAAFRSAESAMKSKAASTTLFFGLRVRMGIATGDLLPGESIKHCAVTADAKVVGQAANGGQVLMNEKAFERVKERLQELGAVDHNGMNYRKLEQRKRVWWKFWIRTQRKPQDEAVVLDMGLYHLKDDPSTKLKLYQLLPPALIGRAKEFKNKLNIKTEYVCEDLPYFSAPGTDAAPLGDVTDTRIVLPPVTMVFCIVEGGKYYAATKSRNNARLVHIICSACIRETLRHVKGGYLCREQDGDLKYMVVFHDSEAALKWCLIIQEVLLYQDWPEAVLSYPKFKEEFGEDDMLLFRGPRLKMGICEGPPKTILPDHLGRADYHGETINQSARYMDAGAHGGQVVCELSLAQKVFDAWTLRYATVSGISTMTRPLLAGNNRLESGVPAAYVRATGLQASQQPEAKVELTAAPSSERTPFSEALALAAIAGPTEKPSVASRGEEMEPEIRPVNSNAPSSPSGATLAIFREPPIFGQQAGEASTGSALPSGADASTTPFEVYAYRTGIFKFKGNPEEIEMVYVALAQLSGRSFPSEPPKGKGNRIAALSGKALSSVGMFPELLRTLRANFVRSQPRHGERWRKAVAATLKTQPSTRPHSTTSLNRRKFADLAKAMAKRPSMGRNANIWGNLPMAPDNHEGVVAVTTVVLEEGSAAPSATPANV